MLIWCEKGCCEGLWINVDTYSFPRPRPCQGVAWYIRYFFTKFILYSTRAQVKGKSQMNIYWHFTENKKPVVHAIDSLCINVSTKILQGNWVFVTYTYFLIPIFLEPMVRPKIFQTMNSVGSTDLILKYNRFTPSCCKDLSIRKFKFLTKNQFLFIEFNFLVWNNCMMLKC